jgi:hypothetical protein
LLTGSVNDDSFAHRSQWQRQNPPARTANGEGPPFNCGLVHIRRLRYELQAPNRKAFSRPSLEPNLKQSFWHFGCAAAFAFLLSQTSLAQKLVDPNAVAPEFRAAAEKRRAEQLKLNECTKKAIVVKVLVRDRAAFISSCVDNPDQTAN